MQCMSRDWSNFLRVDDLDNVIVPKVINDTNDTNDTNQLHPVTQPTRAELLDMLRDMIKRIDELPPQASTCYITHYDFGSALMLLLSILRADCNDDN